MSSEGERLIQRWDYHILYDAHKQIASDINAAIAAAEKRAVQEYINRSRPPFGIATTNSVDLSKPGKEQGDE